MLKSDFLGTLIACKRIFLWMQIRAQTERYQTATSTSSTGDSTATAVVAISNNVPNSGTVAGIVVAILIILALCALPLWLVRRRRRNDQMRASRPYRWTAARPQMGSERPTTRGAPFRHPHASCRIPHDRYLTQNTLPRVPLALSTSTQPTGRGSSSRQKRWSAARPPPQHTRSSAVGRPRIWMTSTDTRGMTRACTSRQTTYRTPRCLSYHCGCRRPRAKARGGIDLGRELDLSYPNLHSPVTVPPRCAATVMSPVVNVSTVRPVTFLCSVCRLYGTSFLDLSYCLAPQKCFNCQAVLCR